MLTEFARIVADMAVHISASLPKPQQWGPVAPRLLGKESLQKTATRRIYDVLNGFEALNIVKRKGHSIHWDVNSCYFPGPADHGWCKPTVVVVTDVPLSDIGKKKRKPRSETKKRARIESNIKKVERVAESDSQPLASVRKRGKRDQALDDVDTTKDSSPVMPVAKMGTDFVKGIVAHAESRMKFPDNKDTAVDTFIVCLMSDSEFSEFERKLAPNPRRDSELFRAKKREALAYYRRRRTELFQQCHQPCKQPDPVMPFFVCTQQMPFPIVQSLSDVEMKV